MRAPSAVRPRSLSLLGLFGLLGLACRSEEPSKGAPAPEPEAPDLTERLDALTARAGFVTDEAALFGGIAAEGRAGDVKLYNDRAAFVVQGLRDGDYYIRQGGGLIDADVVRPEGQPGRDVVDELAVMVGLGRIVAPDAITVLGDGTDGGAAIVEVVGHAAPMALVTGALEAPEMVAEREMTVTTTYTLAPGSPLLLVETTVDWADEDTVADVGDIGLMSLDGAARWAPGQGYDEDAAAAGTWIGVVGNHGEGAFALMSLDEPWTGSVVQDLLGAIGPVITGLQSGIPLTAGAPFTFRRAFGVGPDLATLSDAWLAARGEASEAVGGAVTDGGGQAVSGARVTLFDDEGLPWTQARTDALGGWSAQVPAGRSFTAAPSGRGTGISVELPAGAPWFGPYAAAGVKAEALAAIQDGALPIDFAEGFGVGASAPASASTALSLAAPGALVVEVGDGLPAVVRVDFAAGDPAAVDPRIVPGRPGGSAALCYVRSGQGAISLEPGDYTVTVHRGLRYEPFTAAVTIGSGEQQWLMAELAQVVAPEGVLVLDPHIHASPSSDASVPMEERLVMTAAVGVEVHFGTDHDHVADYRPLLGPLGLEGTLHTVVADEVSPVLRGHFNLYPLTLSDDGPNHGAPLWWENAWTTPELFGVMRDRLYGEPGIIQINHPVGNSGMLGQAAYDAETGTVKKADHWSADFDAMEVLNSGSYEAYFAAYLDLVNRGLLPTPVGVSDSHDYTDGQGDSVTYLRAGVDEPGLLTDTLLVSSMAAHATVVSRGPYIDATVDGAWAPGGLFTGEPTLTVALQHPSFVVIDAVDLYEDGVVVDSRAPTDDMRFVLDGAADAVYVVVARGATPMAPVYPGTAPWAMTAAIRVDRAGDGWTSPSPSLSIED